MREGEGEREREKEKERERGREGVNQNSKESLCDIYIAFGIHVCSAINTSIHAHFAGLLNFRGWSLI